MKAWFVYDHRNECDALICFAETGGKAKNVALKSGELTDSYVEYTDLRAARYPRADNQYRGRAYMDWLDKDDKKFLCENCLFHGVCSFTDEECYAHCMEELKDDIISASNEITR